MHERRNRVDKRMNLINEFTPNLIIQYFTSNLGLDRYNLSSRSEYSRMKELLNQENAFMKTVVGIDEKYEVALFEYKNEASRLRITYRINRLSSYEDQDILNWCTIFKETARICNWTEQIQYEVLKQIVDVNIQIMVGERNNVEDILTALL
ncbi:hypothetical protein DMUE_3012 [Dictyocoela muelleri]|nr:hypothetical protein DMUE_3012 [Dictyocoela muelleri]